jgi:two-component system, chemotaxis family, protein-glutamate methylesterase/glutaminase
VPNETSATVRVLIVDDSALMRKVLQEILETAPEIEVVGRAGDATSAIALAEKLRPDVVTLDIQMPGQTGLEILPTLVGTLGLPVVMVSSLTHAGAEETLAALELGAVDFMPKPDGNRIGEMKGRRDVLVDKVLDAARSRVRRRIGARPPRASSVPMRPARPTSRASSGDLPATPANLPCVVIGISTGGPEALSHTLPLLKPPLPPILIVQHMPATFTGVFASRLARRCSVPVEEAVSGNPVVPNQILIAPGGHHMLITGHPPRCTISITDGPAVSGHRPSVDMLFQSAARAYGPSTVGIIMTGMGRDGVEGCKRILSGGGLTFGQDEDSSVVYGMNKAAFLEGAVQTQFPLENLPALIERFAKPLAGS